MNRRFFCASIPAPGASARLDPAEARHLRTVLRARDGETIGLLDGTGTSATAALAPLSGGRHDDVFATVLTRTTAPPPAWELLLYVAPPRAKAMDLLVRQAAELGVSAVQPVLCEHAVAVPPPSAVDGWADVAREACKQSGNPWLPRLQPAQKLAALLSAGPPAGYIGWLDHESADAPATRLLAPLPATGGRLALWIGPEGGFTTAEARAILAAGAQPLSLGPWTLRVETAVVAGITLLRQLTRGESAP